MQVLHCNRGCAFCTSCLQQCCHLHKAVFCIQSYSGGSTGAAGHCSGCVDCRVHACTMCWQLQAAVSDQWAQLSEHAMCSMCCGVTDATYEVV
jgi:hypothetical protein